VRLHVARHINGRRSTVREGLQNDKLKSIYRSVAGRYDVEHTILTALSDQRGREMVVANTVKEGNNVLDCGSGTGSTSLLAARKLGAQGRLTLFDLSPDMLDVAKTKLQNEGLGGRATYQTGDMTQLPFESNTFDVVLSTYSLCPLYDPAKGALELLRVTKPGGKIGVAHSVEPANPVTRMIGNWIEGVAWRIPSISMGCRAVNVLPALEHAGGKVIMEKTIGVPFWPFVVFVVEKPHIGVAPVFGSKVVSG
jgi:ubiquinone/menaquinone biosynthesis C-methylase UbiE